MNNNKKVLDNLASKVSEALHLFKLGKLSAHDVLEFLDLALWYSDFGEETPILEITKKYIVSNSLKD